MGCSTDGPRIEPFVCFFTATIEVSSWPCRITSPAAHTSPRVKPPGNGGSREVSPPGGTLASGSALPSTRCSHDTFSCSVGSRTDGPIREPFVCFLTATMPATARSQLAHTSPRMKPPGNGGSREHNESGCVFVSLSALQSIFISTRCSHSTTRYSVGYSNDGPRIEPFVCFFTVTIGVSSWPCGLRSLVAQTSPRVKPPGNGGSLDVSMSAVTFILCSPGPSNRPLEASHLSSARCSHSTTSSSSTTTSCSLGPASDRGCRMPFVCFFTSSFPSTGDRRSLLAHTSPPVDVSIRSYWPRSVSSGNSHRLSRRARASLFSESADAHTAARCICCWHAACVQGWRGALRLKPAEITNAACSSIEPPTSARYVRVASRNKKLALRKLK